MTIGLPHYLVVSALLFVLGLYCAATRRNAVAVLMGVELLLNAAGLNFAAFAHYVHGSIDGQIMTIFVIVLAAAEATVALAIVLALHRSFRSIDAAEATTLKE